MPAPEQDQVSRAQAPIWQYVFALLLLALLDCGSSSASPPTALAHQFIEGRQRTYDLQYESNSTTDFKPLFGATDDRGSTAAGPLAVNAIEFSVRAQLLVTTLQAGETESLLAVRCRQPQVQFLVDSRDQRDLSDQVER